MDKVMFDTPATTRWRHSASSFLKSEMNHRTPFKHISVYLHHVTCIKANRRRKTIFFRVQSFNVKRFQMYTIQYVKTVCTKQKGLMK